jgi:O-antigen/teichoic acid export membrane protein
MGKKIHISISRGLYVIINIIMSAIGFIRAFVFMRVLGLYELGLITVFQTIMTLLSIFQVGLINGGYRVYSLGIDIENKRVNNLVFSYFSIIFFICIFIGLFLIKTELPKIILLSAIIGGIISLIVNWLTNTLIGKQLLGELNKINLFSGIGSLLLLPMAYYYKLYGAIIVLLSQPLIFIIFTMLRHPILRPNKFKIDLKLTKRLLEYGFIPYLSGILSLVSLQIERWTIASFLGTENLGRFYLVFLYTTLYVLVPNSVNAIFFPTSIKCYENKLYGEVKKIIKNYYIVLILYSLIVVFITLFFLRPVITLFFPIHIAGIKLVYLILPGLICTSLYSPIGLIMNSAIILKPMLWINIISMLLNGILILFLVLSHRINIQNMAILRSLLGMISLIGYVISYQIISSRLWTSARA